jgi:SOS-response transcriptional repressor LexA
MAGIGDITLVTSDHTARNGDFVLNEVPGPMQRRELLRRLVEENRQRRRVREVDLDSDFA